MRRVLRPLARRQSPPPARPGRARPGRTRRSLQRSHPLRPQLAARLPATPGQPARTPPDGHPQQRRRRPEHPDAGPRRRRGPRGYNALLFYAPAKARCCSSGRSHSGPWADRGPLVYRLLPGPKQFYQFTEAMGAQLHCAPMRIGEGRLSRTQRALTSLPRYPWSARNSGL
jgi:hypothetical protein